jgi:hypothetical protein
MKPQLLTIAFVVLQAPAALAERPPQKRDKADLVVVGTVKKITSTARKFGNDGVSTNYVADVVVDKVEKGEGAKAGDTIKVHWFRVTKRPSKPLAGAYGHRYPLEDRAEARIWLMKNGKDGWSIIYNSDGVELLSKPKK